ncbi:MAG: PorV/PorQ family protein [Candidatus Cloacimonadaceae bacterium]|nr:PorV/PorQ family protein [Candidatus Cloacimonadaceae bacterium]MDP3113391.1 PorV/PorQ family protein [Candidatus Cloacimonadaceae bacterium]
MKKYIITIIALSLLFLPAVIFATPFGKTGTAGLQFLKLGVDARAIGMGEAYTAVTDDVSSVFWNPAGLAPSYQNQAFFSHTNWPANIMHEFAAATYTNRVSTFALYGSVLHMDKIDITDEDPFGPTGEQFTNSSIAFGLCYAKQFTNKFSAGGGVKYLRENLYEFSVNSYAFDLGSMYNTGWKNVKIGMALRNFGPDIRYRVDDDEDGSIDEDPFDLFDNDGDGIIDEDSNEIDSKIPMSFSLGISGDLMRSDLSYWIASLQLDNVIDRKETWNLGTEYKLGNLFLRSGYQINYDTNGLSAGIGYQIPTRVAIFNIDYAYTDMGYLAESFFKSAHRVSLKMRY